MLFNTSTYIQAIEKVASQLEIRDGSYLVTGASGLVGSCLVDVITIANKLNSKNNQVYAMGRSKKKLAHLFGDSPYVHYVEQDVSESINIEDLDFIIHAASNADPKSYALYPVETIMTNVLGSRNVLEYCKKNKTRVLLTSSFEVYGKTDHEKCKEYDNGLIDLNLIRSSYPVSKMAAEMLFKAYYDEYGTDCVIARLSSVYGPTMQKDDSKAHAQFLRNALDGKDIVLKSKGTQKRSYCYVIDAVCGLLSVLFNGQSGEIYNVANENSIATIAEVAKAIADLVGRRVVYDLPDDVERKGFSKPQNCVLDTEKIRQLGWEGKYDLINGLRETIDILSNK